MRTVRYLSFGLILVLMVSVLLAGSAAAQGTTPVYQFTSPSNAVCTGSGVNITYSEFRELPAGPSFTLVTDGFIDNSFRTEGPTTTTLGSSGASGSVGPFNGAFSYGGVIVGVASHSYYRIYTLQQDGVAVYRSTLQVPCNWGGESFIAGDPVITNEVLGSPTQEPTTEPTTEPTLPPTQEPTTEPTTEPTLPPTQEPTTEPTTEPTLPPTQEPTAEPTQQPTAAPTSTPLPVVGVPFVGPGLPGPTGRNLVLFIADTQVLSAQNGLPTGRMMRTCQTAFIINVDPDAEFGQLFVMGGWVPLENTIDVPEEYGQLGFPVLPGCEGR